MYRYSKKTIVLNYLYIGLLVFIGVFVEVPLLYRIGMAFIALLILRDSFREQGASFELAGDRIIVRYKTTVTKEIKFKDILYITITRKNKKWVVVANDEGVLFTVKPKIENHDQMVGRLLELTQSNKKIEVHDYILRTYKKNT